MCLIFWEFFGNFFNVFELVFGSYGSKFIYKNLEYVYNKVYYK